MNKADTVEKQIWTLKIGEQETEHTKKQQQQSLKKHSDEWTVNDDPN